MKTRLYYYLGIIIVGVIGIVIIFSSMPTDTWSDHRTGIIGVSTPDEMNEKIDCLSRGGVWEYTSCSINESEPRISGKMAQEICSITGGECPLNYPVNIQEDGSKMVIVTTWDADTKTEKQFVFFIQNNTLSYEERVNGKLVTEPEQTKIIDNIPLTIPSAQEFLNMDCEDLNHLYPEFPSKEVADAWITRMHECLNEQENEI